MCICAGRRGIETSHTQAFWAAAVAAALALAQGIGRNDTQSRLMSRRRLRSWRLYDYDDVHSKARNHRVCEACIVNMQVIQHALSWGAVQRRHIWGSLALQTCHSDVRSRPRVSPGPHIPTLARTSSVVPRGHRASAHPRAHPNQPGRIAVIVTESAFAVDRSR